MKENKKEVVVKCTDNCSCMSVDKWYDDGEYFITFYKSYQGTTFWRRVKYAVQYIFGKDIIGTELLLYEDEYNKLREF